MISAEIPDYESERLKNLEKYDILDTLAEEEYDDIAKLAAYICDTPIALISLVDSDRQWFKAKVGLAENETSRDIAFCAHAILGDEVFVVPDSTKDERFKDNPLVTGPLDVKYYAGAPITTPEGYAIGTLCVLDHTPRNLSDKQLQALQSLSRTLVQILELRVKLKESKNYYLQLQESENKTREIERQKSEIEFANKLAKSYARFIPSEFLSYLNKKSVLDLKLGDYTEDTMTILFSDIRGFTALSEKMSSEDLLKFLNSYLSIASPIIKSNSGFIDKFIGDAIMAIFPKSPLNALQAATELYKSLEKYNIAREKKVRDTFRIGIGMHTGIMTLGTVGSEDRMDSTVVGDTVNLASRLESLTKEFYVPILISDSFYSSLEEADKENIREIDIVIVKGKTVPVRVYEVFSMDTKDVIEKKRRGIPELNKAIQLYRDEKFIEAKKAFIECQKLCPEDSIPVVYIYRCEKKIEESKSQFFIPKNQEDKIVLVVDDNIAILEVVQYTLKKKNFKVITSINGKDAILKYGEHNPSYVLLDLNMPDMDGIEVASIMKEFANLRKENPLFVFVTSNDDTTTQKKIQELGYEFLPKPLHFPSLIELLENHSKQPNDLQQAEKNVYKNTLDNLLEGCQIIDFEYRYLYLNQVAIEQSNKKFHELVGFKMEEVYPGIENTELYKAIVTCMEERKAIKMKNQFEYPDGRKQWFHLSLAPNPNGILILSIEIPENFYDI